MMEAEASLRKVVAERLASWVSAAAASLKARLVPKSENVEVKQSSVSTRAPASIALRSQSMSPTIRKSALKKRLFSRNNAGRKKIDDVRLYIRPALRSCNRGLSAGRLQR